MAKHIIETMQIVIHKYYVEVDNPEWACDGIVMGELDQFSSVVFSEEITRVDSCQDFPKVGDRNPITGIGEDVNGATCKFNYNTNTWEQHVRWDLYEKV